MKRKMISIFVMLVLMFFTVNVNASDFWEIYGTIEKGNNSGELYNLMPTTLAKNEEFSVKIAVKNIKGWELLNGAFKLTWDKEAFEIVEKKGKYFDIIDRNTRWVSTNLVRDNGINVYFQYDGIPTEDDISVINLTFKTKKDIEDGFYNIYLEPTENLGVDVNGEYRNGRIDDTVLKYQIGKPTVVSNYSKDEIEYSSYVIGEYLFTHSEPTEDYEGSLTTEYIMLASQSINSKDKDKMIIYGKSIKKGWVNAITDESIAVPDEFNIKYVNMKASYQENGIYSDDGDKTILRLIQINDKEAIVTIENDKAKVHGFATMANKVATLKVDGKNYVITISDSGVNVDSSDSYINDVNLVKRVNYSIGDYYDEYYSLRNDIGGSKEYLKSVHTGKYTNGNYELYMYRVNEHYANICIKEKENSNCLIKTIVESNADGSIIGTDNETTYAFVSEESYGGIDWDNDKITLTCYGQCNGNPFVGTYSKESTLKMEDVIKAWEENKIYYRVSFDKKNGENPNYFYAKPNETLSSNNEVWNYFYDHYKEGYTFVEWRYEDSNRALNMEDIINGPIMVYAFYAQLPTTPSLSLVDGTGVYDSELGKFEYNLLVESSTFFDGVEIFHKPTNEPVASGIGGTSSNVRLLVYPNIQNTYYAKTYRLIDGIKYYSDPSTDEITVYPRLYTVSFNLNGGNETIPSQQLAWGDKVTKPVDPTRPNFMFKEWQLNGSTYDFDSPVTDNITLNAVWQRALATPTLSNGMGDLGWSEVTTILEGNYATEQAMSSVDGMELYEVNGNEKTLVIDSSSLVYIAKNVSKTYVARVYVIVNQERVYSDYSNSLTINNIIPAPVISISPPHAGNGDGTDPVYYDFSYDDSINSFKVDVITNQNIIEGCNGDTCEEISGYEWYVKNGDALTKVADNILYYDDEDDKVYYSEVNLFVPEGSSKTFVAKAYVIHNDERIYSNESNELVIDLSNPSYTFETIDTANPDEVLVRAYINDYNMIFNLIIANGSDCPDIDGTGTAVFNYIIDKVDIENEDTITLELSENKSVLATRKSGN